MELKITLHSGLNNMYIHMVFPGSALSAKLSSIKQQPWMPIETQAIREEQEEGKKHSMLVL